MRAAARGLEFTVKPNGTYRLVQKGGKRCLIELVEVSGQEAYCVRLEQALGLPLNTVPRMPAHITLFTEPGGRGIGLYTAEQLETCSFPAVLTLMESPWRLDGNGAILAP